jgi:hypothetical protein
LGSTLAFAGKLGIGRSDAMRTDPSGGSVEREKACGLLGPEDTPAGLGSAAIARHLRIVLSLLGGFDYDNDHDRG